MRRYQKAYAATQKSGGENTHAKGRNVRTCALDSALFLVCVFPPLDFQLSRVPFLATGWDARAVHSPVTYAAVDAFRAVARQSTGARGVEGYDRNERVIRRGSEKQQCQKVDVAHHKNHAVGIRRQREDARNASYVLFLFVCVSLPFDFRTNPLSTFESLTRGTVERGAHECGIKILHKPQLSRRYNMNADTGVFNLYVNSTLTWLSRLPCSR